MGSEFMKSRVGCYFYNRTDFAVTVFWLPLLGSFF